MVQEHEETTKVTKTIFQQTGSNGFSLVGAYSTYDSIIV